MAKEKSTKSTEDTFSYKGWLISDSFLKRSFAVFGYSLIPPLLIYAVILVLALFFGLIAFVLAAVF